MRNSPMSARARATALHAFAFAAAVATLACAGTPASAGDYGSTSPHWRQHRARQEDGNWRDYTAHSQAPGYAPRPSSWNDAGGFDSSNRNPFGSDANGG